MSKEWQKEFSKEKNPLEENYLTRKDKFINGYYSFPYVSRLYIKKFKTADQDIHFIEQVLDKENSKYWKESDATGKSQKEILDIENEKIESQLLIKKVSIKASYYTFMYNFAINCMFISSISMLMFSK